MKLPLALPCAIACAVACVPPGSSHDGDAGAVAQPLPTLAPTFRPSINVMTVPFEDDFSRPHADAAPAAHATLIPSAAGSASGPHAFLPPGMENAEPDELGPNWYATAPHVWHIEEGRLCAQRAGNYGIWLNRVLPVDARIEFDAISDSPQGDLKAEVWGDGRSHATGRSYTNATSYVAILGGWNNKYHVLARENEHAPDRRELKVDPQSDDPREKPVYAGQIYHFKIERTDGHTVRWSVNGLEYPPWDDPQPLAGMGHDHIGFNDWEAKVCFDNVKVTPLP